MKAAVTIVLLVISSGILAATNMPVAVCSPTTNAVPTKAPKKAARQSRPQCMAITLSGNQCKRHAAQGSNYCSQHAAIIRKQEKDKKEKGAQQGWLRPSPSDTLK